MKNDFSTRISLLISASAILSFPLILSAANAASVPSSLVCIGSGETNVRDATLGSVAFRVGQGEGVVLTGNTKSGTVGGQSFVFAEASFPRLNKTGFVVQSYVSPVVACSYFKINPPKALPNGFDPTAKTCAEKLLLAGAKKNVASQFDDRPESTGNCALGVRTSLQTSGVGGVSGGLGNAIDFLHALPAHGFVDSGIRDPNIAPPGAIIVFDGPDSADYLADGNYDTPAGDWLGHVTIKGDDGFYYTDGKTEEPAIGWEDAVNMVGERDVAGIYVPGPTLVAEYASKCASDAAELTSLSLPAATSAMVDQGAEVAQPAPACAGCTSAQLIAALQKLDYSRPADRRTGRRLARQVVDVLKTSRDSVASLLPLVREAEPYDGEGRIASLVSRRLSSGGDASVLTAFLAQQSVSTKLDACKNEQLLAAVSEAARAHGQDSEAAAPFSYRACLQMP